MQQVLHLLDHQSLTTCPASISGQCFICHSQDRMRPATLACGHAFHARCLEDLIRNTRYEFNGAAAVTCPYCGERTAIRDTAFGRIECRPLPRRSGSQYAVAGARPMETLEEFAGRIVNRGSAVLAVLQADVDEIAFPPFATRHRWATLVSRTRERSAVSLRERPSATRTYIAAMSLTGREQLTAQELEEFRFRFPGVRHPLGTTLMAMERHHMQVWLAVTSTRLAFRVHRKIACKTSMFNLVTPYTSTAVLTPP